MSQILETRTLETQTLGLGPSGKFPAPEPSTRRPGPKPASARIRGGAPRRSWVRTLGVVVSGVTMLCATVAFGAFQVRQARAGAPMTYPDTADYIAVAKAPVLSREFLAGRRPPLAPLLWKLTGTVDSFVVAQAVVAAVGWSILAWVMFRLAGGRWRGLFAGGAVLAFASSDPIAMWGRVVLTETVALAALAAVFATALVWVQRPTFLRSLALAGALGLFVLARDSGLVVAVGLVGGMVCYALARRASLSRPAWVGIMAVVVVVVGCALATVESHRYETNFRNVLAARVLPYPERVRWWADQGMPQAAAIESVGRENPSDCGNPAVVSSRVFDQERFAPLVAWLASQGRSVYVKWMVTHPDYILREPSLRPERATCNNGRLHDYAPPDRFVVPYVSDVMYPSWPVTLVMAAVAMVAAAALARFGTMRRRGMLALLALLAGLGMLHMLVAWHSDGMEANRHSLEGNVQARLALVLALVVILVSLRSPRAHTEETGAAVRRAEVSPERTLTPGNDRRRGVTPASTWSPTS